MPEEERLEGINKNIRNQIEEILQKAEAGRLSPESEITFGKVLKALTKANPEYLENQNLFSFKDTVLAWYIILAGAGIDREKAIDIVIGVLLATIYERSEK